MASKQEKLRTEPRVPGLCEMCQNLQKGKDQILLTAVQQGHLDCVKACMAAGASYRNEAVLTSAIDKGFDDCVEVLLKAGTDIYSDHVYKAAQIRSERCVKLLLEAGVHPHTMMETAIWHSGIWKRPNIVHLLINAGADVNCYEASVVLKKAARTVTRTPGSVECLKLLIEAGANLNNTSITHTFISLINSESVECVKLLLQVGADPNAKDGLGSALYHAVYNNYIDIIKILINAGAEIDILALKTAITIEERSALTTDEGSVKCTEELLKAGADVNVADREGNTLLFLPPRSFVLENTLNCYKLLLSEGLKVKVRNRHSLTSC